PSRQPSARRSEHSSPNPLIHLTNRRAADGKLLAVHACDARQRSTLVDEEVVMRTHRSFHSRLAQTALLPALVTLGLTHRSMAQTGPRIAPPQFQQPYPLQFPQPQARPEPRRPLTS